MDSERFALKLSLFGSTYMALLGAGFAFVTRSGAIWLDGFYSLTTVVMSVLTLKVAGLIEQGASRRYQFGHYGFEPLINTIKGVMVLSVSLFALFSAVDALSHGGRELEVGLALVYALLSTTGCFGFALVLNRYARRFSSPLIAVDVRDWTVDGFISSGVALAFGVALVIQHTDWQFLLPYVDPALVMVLALFLIPLPARTVFESVSQLLGAAPDPELEQQIRDRVHTLAQDYPIERLHLQMTVLGRSLYVLVQVLLPQTSPIREVQELDHMRQGFTAVIQEMHPHPDVDIVFTADTAWLKDIEPEAG